MNIYRIIHTEFNPICRTLGILEDNYKILPAMQPDICIKCKSQVALDHLRRNLVHVKDLENNQILIEKYEPLGLFLNVSIQKSKNCASEKKIKIKEKIFRISDLNIDLIKRDQGTGYHIPEGILILYGDIATQIIKLLTIPLF